MYIPATLLSYNNYKSNLRLDVKTHMCGRYTIEEDENIVEMHKILSVAKSNITQTNKNQYRQMKTGEIFPTDYVPVIVPHKNGRIDAVVMRWGFEHPSNHARVINARFEGIRERPMFRGAVTNRRCIIPANAFFEWKTHPQSGFKEKFKISPERSQMLYFGGVYNTTADKDTGEKVSEFVIITKQAQGIFASIHSRMPMVIQKRDMLIWLSCPENEIDEFYYAPAPEFTFRSMDGIGARV